MYIHVGYLDTGSLLNAIANVVYHVDVYKRQAHRLVRAIRAGNPVTQQGMERPSTRPTGSILGSAIGFAAAPTSFVGQSSSSRTVSYTHLSKNRRSRWANYVNSVAFLPYLMPSIAVGVAFFILFRCV